MQVSVQKFTRTTWSRSSAGESGSELSHSVAPPSAGMCTRPDEAIERTPGQATNCWPPSMSYVAPVRAVLVMRWTASAATSAGPTTRPMGSVARSSSRRASSPSPRSDADSGVSTKPAAMRLTRTGASSSARAAVNGRQRGGGRGGDPEVATDPPAAGAAHEQQRAAGPHLAAPRCARPRAPARRGRRAPRAPGRRPSRAAARSAGRRPVTSTWSIGAGRLVEEPLQRCRVGGVEGGGAPRADVARRLLEALGIAAGEDDVGALGAGAPGGLEPDAGAAADQDDGLPEQFRLASACVRGHAHDRLAICASIGVTGRGLSAISMRSAFTAAS